MASILFGCARRADLSTSSSCNSFVNFEASIGDAWDASDPDFFPIPGLERKQKRRKKSSYTSNKPARFQAILKDPGAFRELCQISWSGVPLELRCRVWKTLCLHLPNKLPQEETFLRTKREIYWSLVYKHYYATFDSETRKIYHQISIDVPRIHPPIQIFQQRYVQIMFKRLLFVWALQNPDPGYVQGINDLAAPFFVVFMQELLPEGSRLEKLKTLAVLSDAELKNVEADSFWCFSKLLSCVRRVYAKGVIWQQINQLEGLMMRVDAEICDHLERNGVKFFQFSFRWFNNLLSRELPLSCVLRLWDTYLVEANGDLVTFQLFLCASFLLQFKKELLDQRDFQSLLLMLQNLPTQTWTDTEMGMLLAEAHKLRVIFADAPHHLNGVTTFWPVKL